MWAWTYWLNSAKLYEASTMRQLQSSLPWPAHKLSTGPGFQTYWHFGPYTSQWQGAVLFSSILGLCSLDAHSIPSSYNNKIYLQILIHVPWGAESSLAEKHWCLHFDLLFSRGLGESNEIFFFFFCNKEEELLSLSLFTYWMPTMDLSLYVLSHSSHPVRKTMFLSFCK